MMEYVNAFWVGGLICALAQINRGTFYRHFRDINAFMDELSALLQNR